MRKLLTFLIALICAAFPTLTPPSFAAGPTFYFGYVTGGTQYYQPVTDLVPGSGSALTANTTAYCFFGTVWADVTIKALNMRVTTGVASSNAEFAIYNVAWNINSLQLVDTSAAQVATATSAQNVQTLFANGTDGLIAGQLYAFCTASSGAIAAASFATSSGPESTIGSSTPLNVTGSAAVIGRSYAITYSSTPSSTFPARLSFSGGADIGAASPPLPALAFLVN